MRVAVAPKVHRWHTHVSEHTAEAVKYASGAQVLAVVSVGMISSESEDLVVVYVGVDAVIRVVIALMLVVIVVPTNVHMTTSHPEHTTKPAKDTPGAQMIAVISIGMVSSEGEDLVVVGFGVYAVVRVVNAVLLVRVGVGAEGLVATCSEHGAKYAPRSQSLYLLDKRALVALSASVTFMPTWTTARMAAVASRSLPGTVELGVEGVACTDGFRFGATAEADDLVVVDVGVHRMIRIVFL